MFVGFHGFGQGNADIVKQVAIVLTYWNNKGTFPVKFVPLNMGASVVDDTHTYIAEIS